MTSSPADLLLSRRDLEFQLYDWLDAESLIRRPRFAEHSRESFDAMLDLASTLAVEKLAPHNKSNDEDEPRVVSGRVQTNPAIEPALAALSATGILIGSVDGEHGGFQLPHLVQTACSAWLQAANPATTGYAILSAANANLLLAHGSPEQIETFARPLLEGRFHGTMCLSEPQAGSSLADITTRAIPQPDGTHRLFGNKMWISAGDHELGENIVHLVLARIPGGAPGTKGISLFVVPKFLVGPDGGIGERNDVSLAGLNHKMGLRGITNALLNFGEGAHTPGGAVGAVGYLVGTPGRGLSCMFHMMNEARIAVGSGAMALGYTGYLKSLQYARTRTQGRLPGIDDPTSAQVPLICHADVRRMLLAQKSYVEGALGLLLYCAKLVDELSTADSPQMRAETRALLDLLTPIAKSWPSQWCLHANDLAIQVHGGYGYTRDYDVEQHYRDNRINPIHEGTHGIQAIDLLGRKVIGHSGAMFEALERRIRATIERALSKPPEPAELAAQLGARLDRLLAVTRALRAPGVDSRTRLANASIYLEVVGHIVIGWIWLEQFLATEGREDAFLAGKRQAARYFYRYELPRTGPQLELLARLDRTSLDLNPDWL